MFILRPVMSQRVAKAAPSSLATSHALLGRPQGRSNAGGDDLATKGLTAVVVGTACTSASDASDVCVLHPSVISSPKLQSFQAKHVNAQLFRRLNSEHAPHPHSLQICATAWKNLSPNTTDTLLQDIACASPCIAAELLVGLVPNRALPIHINRYIADSQDPFLASRKMRHQRMCSPWKEGGEQETTLIDLTLRKLYRLHEALAPESEMKSKEKDILLLCCTVSRHLKLEQQQEVLCRKKEGGISTLQGQVEDELLESDNTDRVQAALTYAAAVRLGITDRVLSDTMTMMHDDRDGDNIVVVVGDEKECKGAYSLVHTMNFLRLLTEAETQEEIMCPMRIWSVLRREMDVEVLAQIVTLVAQSLCVLGKKEAATIVCLQGCRQLDRMMMIDEGTAFNSTTQYSSYFCELSDQVIQGLFCSPDVPQTHKLEMFSLLIKSAKRKTGQLYRHLADLPIVLGNGRVFCDALSTMIDFGNWSDVEFLLKNADVGALAASCVPLHNRLSEVSEATVHPKRLAGMQAIFSCLKRALLECRNTSYPQSSKGIAKLIIDLLVTCSPPEGTHRCQEEKVGMRGASMKASLTKAAQSSSRQRKYQLVLGELPHAILSEIVWSLLNFVGAIESGTLVLLTLKKGGFLDLNYYPLPVIESALKAAKPMKLGKADRQLLKDIYMQHVHTFSRSRGPSPYLRFGTGHSLNRHTKDLVISTPQKRAKRVDECVSVHDKFCASARISPGGGIIVDKAFVSWMRKGTASI